MKGVHVTGAHYRAMVRGCVRNTGNIPVTVRSAKITGPDAGDFEVSNDVCSDQKLAPNVDCAINVRLAPTATGSGEATLLIDDSTAARQHTVRLSGASVPPTTITTQPPTGHPLEVWRLPL